MRSFWIPLAAAALASAGAVLHGCSNKSGCDSSQCAPGNQCIDDGTGSGATCHKVCIAQADCPANYYCNDGRPGSGTVSWCVANTTAYEAGVGHWGAPCSAMRGEGANPDCNWSQGFACYATGPDDANAFCTQFGCAGDADCPGGWWCSTQNIGPNATSSMRTFGTTRTVCVPREFCAPCTKDLDCYVSAAPASPRPDAGADGGARDSAAGSAPSLALCVPDVNGANFCTTQCTDDSTCPLYATCLAPWKVCIPSASGGQACTSDDQCPPSGGTFQHCVGGRCTPECASASDCASGQSCAANTKVCIPRAGVCVGDGGLCSPCRSDDNCASATSAPGAAQASGYCFNAPYSNEPFCSAPSTASDCDAGAVDPPGCPTPQSGQNWSAVACAPGTSNNQCYGLVTLQGQLVPGCWTVNR